MSSFEQAQRFTCNCYFPASPLFPATHLLLFASPMFSLLLLFASPLLKHLLLFASPVFPRLCTCCYLPLPFTSTWRCVMCWADSWVLNGQVSCKLSPSGACLLGINGVDSRCKCW
jgi:hypothetical protein